MRISEATRAPARRARARWPTWARRHPAPAPIPVARPLLPPADALLPYLRRIDELRVYANFGPLNAELEARLADRLGLDEGCVVCTSSATLGLVVALMASSGGRPGRCLMPSWTFVATAHAARLAGLEPHFLDVSPDTWQLEPEAVRHALDTVPEVRAVVVVAPFGRPVDLEPFVRIRAETDVPVVVDAAAAFDGQEAGALPVVVSMHATKVLGAGEGGFVAVDDAALAARIRQAANFGFEDRRQALVAATNAKLSEYGAAVALASLDRWPTTRRRFARVIRAYHEALGAHASGVRPVTPSQFVTSTMVVELPRDTVLDAVHVERALAAWGIATRRWWASGCHREPVFASCSRGELSVTEDLARRALGLPLFVDMTEAEVARVVRALHSICEPAERGRAGNQQTPASASVSSDPSPAGASKTAAWGRLRDLDRVEHKPGLSDWQDRAVRGSLLCPPVGGFFGLEHAALHAREGGFLACWRVPADESLAFANARSALGAFLAGRRQATLWLPAWCCPELASALELAPGWRLRWYPLDHLDPATDALAGMLRPGDVVVVVDFFGRRPGPAFLQLVNERDDVVWVEDQAQVVPIGGPPWGDLVLASPRKVVGVPDGGWIAPGSPRGAAGIAPDLGIPPALRSVPDGSLTRLQAVLARLEHEGAATPGASGLLAVHRRVEASMRPGRARMSRLSRLLLGTLDPAPLAARRRQNFKLLASVLNSYALLDAADAPEAPFAFPIIVAPKRRDELQRRLAARGVFAAVHWPALRAPRAGFAREHRLAASVLALPCDHRYDEHAMSALASVVLEALDELGLAPDHGALPASR